MKSTSKLGRDGRFWGLVMIAPTIIGLMILNIIPFFQTIYSYANGKGLKVIGNPGAYPAPKYADLADVLVTYTGPASSYRRFDS